MRAALMDLALKYFRQKGYKIEQDAVREGSSGLPRRFDLFVERGNSSGSENGNEPSASIW